MVRCCATARPQSAAYWAGSTTGSSASSLGQRATCPRGRALPRRARGVRVGFRPAAVGAPVTVPECVICGGATVPAFIATDRNRRISDRAVRVPPLPGAAARSCWRAVPEDIGRYYPHEYYSVPSSREELMITAAPERYKLDLVGRSCPRGRLIEVGPAIGGFAVHAQGAGYDTSAIEMDPDCCGFLRDVVGIEVHETSDPAVALRDNGPFDVIAMWQVLEHLPDPVSVLVAAAAALAPGGVLVIAVPNPEALQFRMFGAAMDAHRRPAASLADPGAHRRRGGWATGPRGRDAHYAGCRNAGMELVRVARVARRLLDSRAGPPGTPVRRIRGHPADGAGRAPTRQRRDIHARPAASLAIIGRGRHVARRFPRGDAQGGDGVVFGRGVGQSSRRISGARAANRPAQSRT